MRSGDSGSVGGQYDDLAVSSVTYHAPTGTYRTEFDSNTRTAAEAIVSSVARASGRDPLELPPLYRSVDPGALNELFDSSVSGVRRTDVTLAFEYGDHEVIVNGHGTVEVFPLD